jgi:hypothetical protein
MSPAKSLGGGGVQKFHEILQQICENIEGWPKNFKKCHFCPNFQKKNLRGVKAKPPTSTPIPPGIMYDCSGIVSACHGLKIYFVTLFRFCWQPWIVFE